MNINRLLLVFLSCFILVTSGINYAQAANSVGASDGLIISYPEEGFLDINNLAPGDSVTSSLTVKNGRSTDIEYSITVSKKTGNDMLYSILNIVVKEKDEEIIYQGKLKDLNNVKLGKLAPSQDESFYFSLSLPYTVGNEYQKLSVTNTFTIAAKEVSSAVNGENDTQEKSPQKSETLPVTGSNTFWLIPVGAIVTILGVTLLMKKKTI